MRLTDLYTIGLGDERLVRTGNGTALAHSLDVPKGAGGPGEVKEHDY